MAWLRALCAALGVALPPAVAAQAAEPPVFPTKDGSTCATLAEADVGEDRKLNCNLGLGSATFVTGAFGFAAAGLAVERIVQPAKA